MSFLNENRTQELWNKVKEKVSNVHGVPEGGTAGQVLSKSTDEDYATDWIDLPDPGSAEMKAFLVRAPVGSVVMWMSDEIPAGWHLCDGTDGTPDLRKRYIVGNDGRGPGTVLMSVDLASSNTGYGVVYVNFIQKMEADPDEVPAGGTTGQVLGKLSDADHDIGWINTAALSETHYTVAAPVGSILMWTSSTIPEGWHICDGTDGTPNLIDRYPIGSDAEHLNMSAKNRSLANMTTVAGYYYLYFIMKMTKDETDNVSYTEFEEGLATKQNTLIPDDTIKMVESGIGVAVPTKHYTKEEYEALEGKPENTLCVVEEPQSIPVAVSVQDYDTSDGWHVRKWSDGYVKMSITKEYTSPKSMILWEGWRLLEQLVPKNELPVSLIARLDEHAFVVSPPSDMNNIDGSFYGLMQTGIADLTHTSAYSFLATENYSSKTITVLISVTGRWKEATS